MAYYYCRSGVLYYSVSRKALIYSAANSDQKWKSVDRDLRTAHVGVWYWFLLWSGHRRRAVQVDIRQVEYAYIRCGLGAQMCGGGGYSIAFSSWNLELNFRSGTICGRHNGKVCHPQRYLPWHQAVRLNSRAWRDKWSYERFRDPKFPLSWTFGGPTQG